MKKIYAAIVIMFLCYNTHSQCISGDCKNGKGKFDFGWCVYEGEFKNEKPEGNGIMKYDDYSYTGNFKNGVEDGKGIITYKNGKTEEVRYSNGKKLDYKPTALKDGEYKELEGHDVNCKSGDCNNGFGTYVFPSGNKYVGNFVNNKREGKGIYYFANGEKFEGIFHDNEKYSGTYTFNTGITYTGTYSADGEPYNGTVSSGGITLPYVNGKAIIPPKPLPIYESNTTNASNSTKKSKADDWAHVLDKFQQTVAENNKFVEGNHRALERADRDIREARQANERQHERDRRGY